VLLVLTTYRLITPGAEWRLLELPAQPPPKITAAAANPSVPM
jgi:hypothetical protein